MKLSKIIQDYKDHLPSETADNTNIDLIDKRQLAVGILVELEHTNDIMKSMTIAIDHLKEYPLYYSKLIECGLIDETPAIEMYEKLYNK